jgi:hypothetical protein
MRSFRSRLALIIVMVGFCWGKAVSQQSSPSESFMKQAVIVHHGGTATVMANAEDPLAQALLAMSREYAWVVDYEGFSPHPGAFQCDYDEGTMIKTPEGEKAVLEKVVAAYNGQASPFHYQVFKLGDSMSPVSPGPNATPMSRFSVEAISPSVLVSGIVVPREKRSAQKTMELIVETYGAPDTFGMRNPKLVLGEFPKEALANVDVTVGGQTATYILLVLTLNQTGRPMIYQMVPDSKVHGWVLNIYLVNH